MFYEKVTKVLKSLKNFGTLDHLKYFIHLFFYINNFIHRRHNNQCQEGGESQSKNDCPCQWIPECYAVSTKIYLRIKISKQ